MASFQQAHRGTIAQARGWRGWRRASLYGAAVAAGAAIGIGLTFVGPGDSKGEPSAASVPVTAPSVPDIDYTAFSLVTPLIFGDSYAAPETPDPAPVLETQAAPEAPAAPANAAPAPASSPAQTQPQPAPKPATAPPPAPAEKPNFYLPEVPGGGASNPEARLLDGLNAQRAAAGLAPYAYDAGLSRIARIRVRQMADQGYFGHVDPYGYSMYTELLVKFGYGWNWAGENLALNNYSMAESPERAVVSLMNSPSHRANILDTDFYRVGIGEFTTADGRHFYAMIFLG